MVKLNIVRGDRYGKLNIIKELETKVSCKGYRYRIFLCQCDCGIYKNVSLKCLRNGQTKSCGCVCKGKGKTHGMSNTDIYNVYKAILQRCRNMNNKYYHNYGGRGINCEWGTFNEFYKDMGGTYKKGLTIERLDNNKGYYKNNCKWASMKEQGRNRRTNVLYKGKTITEWSTILGIKRGTIYSRLHRGKTIKQALGASEVIKESNNIFNSLK